MLLSYWKWLSLASEIWDVWRQSSGETDQLILLDLLTKDLRNFLLRANISQEVFSLEIATRSRIPNLFGTVWSLDISPFYIKCFVAWIIYRCKYTRVLCWGSFFEIYFFWTDFWNVLESLWDAEDHWFIPNIVVAQDVHPPKSALCGGRGWGRLFSLIWSRIQAVLERSTISLPCILWNFSEAHGRALGFRVLYKQLQDLNECFIFMAGSIYHQMALLYH